MMRPHPTPWHSWYGKLRWKHRAKHQLQIHPLCKYCLDQGIVTPATIADHVTPHHGNVNAFWLGPLQSLCKHCHDSGKKAEESRGYRRDIGPDGWPTDPNHPAYAKRKV
jgi:5-methylcytosine-specific restriction endonuclease McrA